ncbi:MAG: SPFH domain-containing protein, partial [Planctomycetota bacterium]
MTEHNHQDKNNSLVPAPELQPGDELDTAGKSLSEALRISFIILKVIMIVLIVAFLASGFETVGSEEQAIVLRFGKIRGAGEKRLLGPGPHWILPYPIDEIVKIPIKTQVNLPIDSFWYFQTQQEILSGKSRPVRPDKPLNPLVDGYCITRSEMQAGTILASGEVAIKGKVGISYRDGELGVELKDLSVSSQTTPANIGSGASDYNIVHTKWQLTYQIDDPERFFRNIYVEDFEPGDIYFNVITKSITPLLKNMFEDSVVTAMVNYTIDEAISSRDRIPKHVKRLLQEKLEKIESGIKIVSIQLIKSESPPQVKTAFEASTMASQRSETEVTSARTYAENTLNKAGGPIAFELLKGNKTVNELSEQEEELLWDQLAGTAREKIAEARSYRARVVETAKANADYLERLLPEYRQRPELVIQKIYLDALENIMNNSDEKFVIQTSEGSKGTQIRVLLNRDP